ncbi:MAG: hypothetical protein ACJBCI_06740, partial [Candidatus Tisiphia sp.]
KQDGSLLRYEVFKIQSFNSRYSLPILPLYITDHVIFIMAFLLYEFDIGDQFNSLGVATAGTKNSLKGY